MKEREFEIGGNRFQLNPVSAHKQFHIVRRLAPILKDIIPAAQEIKGLNLEGMTEEEKFQKLSQMIGPVLDGFSKLSDADADFVLNNLLSSVQIQQANNWAWVAKDGILMFQTLKLPVLMQIAGKAIGYNLSDFFASAHQII